MSVNLFCIRSSDNKSQKRAFYIKEACQKKGVSFNDIDAEKFQFKLPDINVDLLLRVSNQQHRLVKESEIFLLNPKTTTFYNNYFQALSSFNHSSLILLNNKLPIPQTKMYTGQTESQLNKLVLDELQGFPIVVKVAGGSKGIGTMKIDSIQALTSVLDYLSSMSTQNTIILKQFIDVGHPPHSYRGVIIGGELVVAYKNTSTSDLDFRSNTNQLERQRTQVNLNPNDQKTLVKAAIALGYELAAIDFVFDQNHQLKIFEVNFPFNFLPIIEDLQYPIQEKMLDYLIIKHKKSL